MHCGRRELCYLAQKRCLLGGGGGGERESNLAVIENSLMSLQDQKENVSNKESSFSHP